MVIKPLAKLASLSVTDDEAVKLESQFSDTLKVVKQLEELDTSKVKPTPQVTNQVNHFREDKVDLSRQLTQSEALANAANSHRGYFVVPAIL